MGVGKARVARAARWFARVASLAALALAASIVAAGVPVSFTADTTAGVLSAFFFLLACLGLIVGWRWEGAGGMLTVGAVLAMDAIHLLATGGLPRSWTVSLVALCGFFFILSRALNVSVRHETSSALQAGSGSGPG